MSGSQAFLSFVNYLQDALSGSGVTVNIKKGDTLTPPYLNMQAGPEEIISHWLSSKLCQAWVVVEENPNEEPLVVTEERVMNLVIKATQDAGSLPKYDYEQNPTVQTGLFTVHIEEITGDMSNEQKTSRRVITWLLHSNSKR